MFEDIEIQGAGVQIQAYYDLTPGEKLGHDCEQQGNPGAERSSAPWRCEGNREVHGR